jgi:hypothetical protein
MRRLKKISHSFAESRKTEMPRTPKDLEIQLEKPPQPADTRLVSRLRGNYYSVTRGNQELRSHYAAIPATLSAVASTQHEQQPFLLASHLA